ncbi:unnamed protein product [Macrosiphum euphorbiae]|uniref:Uncharacterized protein n=1 Tax=Macrosiphum euphorbiae TaxID=13131 RepID=A0AAV0XCL5_9HEMI|nr:unnamed protein product [Macrosiphum euphorbiae]
MLPTIYGHKIFTFMSNPISNPKYMENIYLNGPAILLTGSNIVDPFFFVSGFIMYTNLSREFRKSKNESVWKTLYRCQSSSE